MELTDEIKRRVENIRRRWLRFEYKGQADYDVRLMLKLILGKDPNYEKEENR